MQIWSPLNICGGILFLIVLLFRNPAWTSAYLSYKIRIILERVFQNRIRSFLLLASALKNSFTKQSCLMCKTIPFHFRLSSRKVINTILQIYKVKNTIKNCTSCYFNIRSKDYNLNNYNNFPEYCLSYSDCIWITETLAYIPSLGSELKAQGLFGIRISVIHVRHVKRSDSRTRALKFYVVLP